VAHISFLSRSLLVLLAAGYLLFTAIQGLATGRVNVIYRTAKRTEDETLFWVSVVISAILSLAAIFAVLW
jgi:hypothetical protein